ncbi:MAG TPA: D-alanyl-D-alanine carboxypeptidase family protein [Dissulfurispiraceae bacterium]|nr:D-alanyl-D-alanine carboxypeptidase family protein [Dissulfurispiraceae bacterium]
MKRMLREWLVPGAAAGVALRCAVVLLCGFLWSAGGASAQEISAKAGVVIDGSSGKILYAKNPHLKLPPASTTKLVTAMVALDRMSPERIVTVSANAAETPSVAPHLKAGEKVTVRDLLYLALMRSVNGAAVALAEASAGSEEAFAAMMNEKVQSIDAENTHFVNASGLPGPDQYITAYDLARVMTESLRYPLITEIINTRTKYIVTPEGRRYFLKNTNQLLWTDEDLVGGKTGYTRAAQHCFVCAAEKGDAILIAAVLGESVREGLWHESAILLSKGYDVIMKKSEPMIYYTSVNERKVMRASYTVEGPRKTGAKTKKERVSASKRSRQRRSDDNLSKGTARANGGSRVRGKSKGDQRSSARTVGKDQS